MTGFRDRSNPTAAHTVQLGREQLRFGSDGVLWEPNELQRAAMTADSRRRSRFAAVDSLAKAPVVEREPVAGKAMAAALVTPEAKDSK